MEIIAFDPGQTTGWRYVDYVRSFAPEEHEWHGGILGPEKHHLELWGLLETLQPQQVVMEHFVPQTRGDAPVTVLELISRDYEGVIELWCRMHNVPLKKQNASEGKGLFSPDKLDRLALWKPSKHTRDATSHLLHYITTDLKDYRWLRMIKPG